MKIRLAATLVAGIALGAFGARLLAQDEEHVKKVRKLLSVSGTEELITGQLARSFAQMRQNVRDKDSFDKWAASIKASELVDLSVPIYAKHVPAEDVDAMIAFYEAPAGKRFVAAQPKIQKEVAEATTVWMTQKLDAPDGPLAGARRQGNEASAIGALKTICTSQSIFREADKENDGELDYGTLEELGKSNLIDSVLASGKKQGYLFRCNRGTKAPEFLWWATATPEKPGTSGDRYFFVNQAGVVYYSNEPFQVDEAECKVPEGLKPVGR